MFLLDKLDYLVISATVDVNDLLSKEGAAGGEGALSKANEQVKELGAGAFQVVRNGVVYVLAIALIIAAGAMAVHARNASKRDDDKTAIVWTFIAALVAFGAISILVFLSGIGANLFNN